MAVFEKDRASRRYYLESADELSAIKASVKGGIPTGSIATYTDKGTKWIYDGQEWTPWAGDSDELLIEIRDAINAMAWDASLARQALAVMVNEQSGTNFPTGDE